MPQNRFDSGPRFIPHTSPRARSIHLFIGLLSIALSLLLTCPSPSQAEVRVVTGTGEHRMNDHETKTDGIRLATEQAKKQALEQVASYLESVTVVRDLDVTLDEIRSYTAGMVLVLDQHVTTALNGEFVVVRVELTAQVNTDEVAQAIATLRQNEDAREQLLALRRDVESLQQELDAANDTLAVATSPEQVQELSHERNELLNRAESDAMVAQAWTDWVLLTPFAQPSPSAGLAQIHALLGLASRLNPDNPHLAIAQQTVGTKAPPAPPQPRRPPVPHTVPFLPGYAVVPQQSAQPGAIQVPAQPGAPLPQGSLGTMPTYRRVPPPSGRPAARTLHTYRSGVDQATPAAEQPSINAPRGTPPAIIYQVPKKPVPIPTTPSQQIPGNGTHQGGTR
ncbi:MAG TPA: hypothetical protein PK224_07805 [Nitrospira sp.]|nr:hypothetical protein [Nitrospira sp.]